MTDRSGKDSSLTVANQNLGKTKSRAGLKIGLSVMALPLLAGCYPLTQKSYCDIPKSKYDDARNCNVNNNDAFTGQGTSSGSSAVLVGTSA